MAVRVRVHTSVVNYPGGVIYSFMADMGREAVVAARAAAPERSGRLAASIKEQRRSNQYGVWLHLLADAPYARYVHQGTTGPIHAGGEWLPVGKSQGAITHFATEVSGQSPQPFLLEGMSVALVANGLRPVI